MAPPDTLREAHPAERAAGIDHYVSDADGIGGRLRESPEDFRVRELEAFEPESLGGGHRELPRARRPRHPPRLGHERLRAPDLRRPRYQPRERVSGGGDEGQACRHHAAVHAPRGRSPDDLPEIRGAEIEPLGRAGRGLSFGDLAGNAFEIRVADTVPEAPERVADVVGDLQAFGDDAEEATARTDDDREPKGGIDGAIVGVPNYFGQQRFGSRRPVTHRVGLAVVRDDFREAVRLYAGNPSETEPDDTRAAGGGWTPRSGSGDDTGDGSDPAADGTGDGDWETCLDAIPGKLRFERSMVHRLAERDVAPDAPPDHEDWRHALEAVPSNLQRLFVNAAQSFLFNQMLSERAAASWAPVRPPVVAGDVVCFADGGAPDELRARHGPAPAGRRGPSVRRHPPLRARAGVRHRPSSARRRTSETVSPAR